MSLTHQFWPKLDNEACRTVNTSVACIYNSLPSYDLVSASGNIRFKDNYTLSFGIENLLDTDPPCINANPTSDADGRVAVPVPDGVLPHRWWRGRRRGDVRSARPAVLRQHELRILI